MKYALVALAFLTVACAQNKVFGLDLGSCSGQGFIDGSKIFLCMDKGKAHPRIMPGYNTEQALILLIAREDHAWNQLMAITDSQERVDYIRERAKRSRDEYGKSPRVHDIATAQASKTMDTGTIVLQLTTADGQRASLWLDGADLEKGLRVRSATNY